MFKITLCIRKYYYYVPAVVSFVVYMFTNLISVYEKMFKDSLHFFLKSTLAHIFKSIIKLFTLCIFIFNR